MKQYTRQEAKALGLNKCYGSACVKHPELEGFRWVSGACVECARELLRKSRAANPEKTQANRKKSNLKIAEQRRPGGLKHEKKIAYDVQYRKENRDSCRASILAWSAKNPEKVKLYAAKNKANNKGKVNANTVKRRLAKANRTPAWLTTDDYWMIEQAYELATLRTELFGFAWHVDHVLPLQGKLVSGFHTPYNLQVIPGVDNVRKSNTFEAAVT